MLMYMYMFNVYVYIMYILCIYAYKYAVSQHTSAALNQTPYRAIGQCYTPVDKLLVLKKTVTGIRECVDRNVRRNFANADVELSTDDLVLLLIWVVVQTAGHYGELATDLRYISDFHFVSSSRSQLGFTMCHFQVSCCCCCCCYYCCCCCSCCVRSLSPCSEWCLYTYICMYV